MQIISIKLKMFTNFQCALKQWHFIFMFDSVVTVLLHYLKFNFSCVLPNTAKQHTMLVKMILRVSYMQYYLKAGPKSKQGSISWQNAWRLI